MEWMKKLNGFQRLLILAIAIIVFSDLVFFKFEIVGTYLSNAEEPTLEMPGKGAELYLYKNGTYSSNSFMGSGTYTLKGDVILISNNNQSWGLPLVREYNIGKPMIVINDDLGYYFIKQ